MGVEVHAARIRAVCGVLSSRMAQPATSSPKAASIKRSWIVPIGFVGGAFEVGRLPCQASRICFYRPEAAPTLTPRGSPEKAELRFLAHVDEGCHRHSSADHRFFVGLVAGRGTKAQGRASRRVVAEV